jgi:repressor LexA
LVGKIAAGTPILAQENIEGYIDLEDSIKADFCLTVEGDSMINARINDGDIVFIRQQPEVEEGEIAAVLIDGEATLKRFYRHENAVELRPENSTYKSMFFTSNNCTTFKILGKAVAFQSMIK